MGLSTSRSVVYDVDVHNSWSSDEELAAYLPRAARERFATAWGRRLPAPAALTYSRPGGTTDRLDAAPPEGGRAGSRYGTLAAQLLDPHGIDRALLTFNPGSDGARHDAELAIDVCRAANDWLIDRWLDGGDPRLYGVLMLPTATPDAAAAEIRRAGGHPRIAGALMVANPLNRPFGHPVYRPIIEAVAELDLTLVAHIGGDLRSHGTAFASALPTTRADAFALVDQPAVHHLTSLIVSGVFEEHPRLRLLFNECGYTWLPHVFWSLDAQHAALRAERPRLRRAPSDYLREHVWLSSQPFDSAAGAKKVLGLLGAFGGMEDRLCFASDYPHHDSESPSQVASRLPRSWRDGVLAGNAARALRWPVEKTIVERPAAARPVEV
ncbi:MAG TPA: amidohydrolase family protein [Baekduia sp.]|jgi:hypothetical protein